MLASESREVGVDTRPYRVCSSCVMDTSDLKITFDADGVCDHCRTYYRDILPHWHPDERGRRALARLADRIREAGKDKPFDCIIGVSGGVDSSYLAYLSKAELGLRPLLFHVDTGWNSQESVHNIATLVDKLGLDLYTEVVDWDEMRDLQVAFFKAGVPHIDTPQDHAIFAALYRFADREDVKFILTGANYSTECIRNPVDWMYYQTDSVQLRDIHRRYGSQSLSTFPITSVLWHKVYLPYVRRIRVIKPLNYMPYRKQEAMRLLLDKIGWSPYPQKHFESRFTAFYEGYWLYRKFGYDTRRVQFSSLILTKQMTREEALKKLAQPPLDESTVRREFEYVATKLNITADELQRYMDSPSKSYKDYRSMDWMYTVGAKAMRLLGLEHGGKR